MWNGICTEEIPCRISMCKRVFEKANALLAARWNPIQMKKRYAKRFILSVVSGVRRGESVSYTHLT